MAITRTRSFELSVNPGKGGAWQIYLAFPGGGPGRYRDIRLGNHRLTLNGPWFSTYPRPDRSEQHRNFSKTAENDAIDIGWCDGKLRDGRPYLAELWAQDQVSCVTLFFSRTNLEGLTDETAANILEREGLVRFKTRYCGVAPWTDAAGNGMWSLNLRVGDANGSYLLDSFSFHPYIPAIAQPDSPDARERAK